MGDRARGDCKKMTCSSEDEDFRLEEYYNSIIRRSTTGAMIPQFSVGNKRYPLPGTSGEAPTIPEPPIADDTDRQFWAEDEMSSSDSRLRLVCKRRRKHSLAYRNRASVRKRSRSLLCQSSSSSSDRVESNVPSPLRCIVDRPSRCNSRAGVAGPSTTEKLRATNFARWKIPGSRPLSPPSTPSVKAVTSSCPSKHQPSSSTEQAQAQYTSSTRRRSKRSKNQTLSQSDKETLPFTKESPNMTPKSEPK